MIRKKRMNAFHLIWLVVKKLIFKDTSYLVQAGWVKSFRERKPVDREGKPLPWMNYPVISFLRQRLSQNMDVFEFGSGYSTLFFADLVHSVTSLEYDREWVEVIKPLCPKNVQLHFQEADCDGHYCRMISGSGDKYDLVVIDGRDRVNCLIQAIGSVNEGGAILFDDFDRERYREGVDYAVQKGFRSLEFEGMKPTETKLYRSALFYRDENCFGI